MFKRLFNKKRIVIYIVTILITYVFTSVVYIPYYNATQAIAYSIGSRGDVVTQVQNRLKDWGYYFGNVDGIYGYMTYSAVKKYQQYNGLTADGVAGNNTLASIGINVAGISSGGRVTSNDQDVVLLSRLINGEARGEPYEGQVAVGAVVLNRTRNPKFPSTVAGVIYQPGAFTAIVDGQIHANIQQSSINAARDALNGWDPSGGAMYYFNPSTATSSWIWSRPLIKIIGKHRFCQ